jgi:hypothetical protein
VSSLDPAAPVAPTRAEAFRYWLKLGFVSFGGPAGQIAIMHHDLVDSKRWISEQRFLHALNYCMVLQGRKRSSSQPISGGSCTGRGAGSSRAGCSCCRRSCC